MLISNNTFVGIDGCKSGWFAFFKQQAHLSYGVFANLYQLTEMLAKEAIVLIDMPIGFPDLGQPFRACDKLARTFLPGRAASVFPVPCKAAIYAEDYAAACQINEDNIGKRFPIQTWNIIPKIRELDSLLMQITAQENNGIRFFESHPELLFAGLAGQPMAFSKANVAGQQERLAVLATYATQDMNILEDALSHTPKKQAKADDIIDAFVLMLAASCRQEWQFLPATPDPDHDGNARQIVFIRK